MSDPAPLPPSPAPAPAPADSTAVTEHLILFNFTEQAQKEEIDALLESLGALSSIPQVHYVFAGPIFGNYLKVRAQKRFGFILHARFLSPVDLLSFTTHPDYLRALEMMSATVVENKLTVEFTMRCQHFPTNPKWGQAVRIALFATSSDMKIEFRRVEARYVENNSMREAILQKLREMEANDESIISMTSGIVNGDEGYSVGCVACAVDWNTMYASTLDDIYEIADSADPGFSERKSVFDAIVVDYEAQPCSSAPASGAISPLRVVIFAAVFVVVGALFSRRQV